MAIHLEEVREFRSKDPLAGGVDGLWMGALAGLGIAKAFHEENNIVAPEVFFVPAGAIVGFLLGLFIKAPISYRPY